VKAVLEVIKSLIRPIGLLFWLIIRTLCAAQGVDIELSFLSVVLDAAVAEYFAERAYKRYKETKNA
jgi:hypothetical protein